MGTFSKKNLNFFFEKQIRFSKKNKLFFGHFRTFWRKNSFEIFDDFSFFLNLFFHVFLELFGVFF